jgi:hypothetical protein
MSLQIVLDYGLQITDYGLRFAFNSLTLTLNLKPETVIRVVSSGFRKFGSSAANGVGAKSRFAGHRTIAVFSQMSGQMLRPYRT